MNPEQLIQHFDRISEAPDTWLIDPSRHSGMDCRNPGAKDGNGRHVPVTWTPAFPVGVTAS